jgi:hypothetical protein
MLKLPDEPFFVIGAHLADVHKAKPSEVLITSPPGNQPNSCKRVLVGQ